MGNPSSNLVPGPAGFWLLPGIYDGTFSSLQTLVCTNAHRRAQWEKVDQFVAWAPLEQFSHLYFTGALLSCEEKPQETEIILKTKDPYGPGSFAAMEPFFAAKLERIREQYGVALRFWIENAPASLGHCRRGGAEAEAAQNSPLNPAQITVRVALAESRTSF